MTKRDITDRFLVTSVIIISVLISFGSLYHKLYISLQVSSHLP